MEDDTSTIYSSVASYGDEENGEEEGYSLGVQIVFGSVILLSGLSNIIGNSCTLIAFATDPKLRTAHNCYIANLAATDLTIGVSSVPFYAVYTLRRYYWQFGYLFCKIWCVVDFLVCAESALTVILISHDRYLLLKDGAFYQEKNTRKKALIKITVSWILAFLLYGPAIIGFNHWRGYSTVDEDDCDVEFADDFWYTLITALIEFGVPAVLLSSFNVYIFWKLRQRSLKVGAGGKQKGATVAVTSSSMSGKDVREANNLKRCKKAARSLIILVVVFALCWAPYTISTIVLALCDTCISEDVFESFNWLLWMNSAVNPLLYAVTNPRFRAHFRRMLLPQCIVKIYSDRSETGEGSTLG